MTTTRQLGAALKALLVLTVLCGVLYPAAILAVGLVVPDRANGQPVVVGGREVGSALLGQPPSGPEWFQGRPSASDSSGDVSGGSNYGPSNPDLAADVAEREKALRAANPDAPQQIPADALTTSASGLDPDVSPEYARWQVARVAAARGLEQTRVLRLVDQHVREAPLGFLGQDRVNVLELNVALAGLTRG
ncbi:potassium-transporting ATPase subunit KdpC [Phycicoccus sonneratiae]|uniref:Potassium-transporting ATPase KdpC subunit n=1 Tax=Phycicoccus sonneratiae TaxID=2807628 RepID=A0ABS2CR61_9MICO|nr:potassium-transporting ATPase subunit KdpC [Phycicoccus sonneraticus]MBM6402380.1 potassium-transporting ATPase subunit KdpC [Phycicoccus sonneraticus]